MSATSDAVTIQSSLDVCIIRFEVPRIDHENFDELSELVLSAVDTEHPKRVLANLRKVEYLHSVGIGLLAALGRRVGVYGGELRLCSLQPEVHELLTITQMHRLFEVYDTERSALAEF